MELMDSAEALKAGGVWRSKEGGFLVLSRAVDARTGKLMEVKFDDAGAGRAPSVHAPAS